jgi:dolichyl-phosphate-mannose--protein O-mannosyl transferase
LLGGLYRITDSRHFGLISTLGITLLAALLRFIDLAHPRRLIFDETYYVKDAYALGQSLVERRWPEGYNGVFEAGEPAGFLPEAAFVVHPPLGKWLIWLGMAVFGADSSFGWRFSVALIGTLTVPLLIATARLLFRSKVWASVAGLLLAIEGQHIVLSRTAILDVMLTAFVLLGFYFVLLDRAGWRDKLSLRPWLVAAGVALGAAAAIKWSAIWALAGFGLYAVLSLLPGSRRPLRTLFGQGALSFVSLVPIALATYISSWWGWLISGEGWGRELAPNPLLALLNYHQRALSFHTGLNDGHNYESGPLEWLVSARPVAFWFERSEIGVDGCAFSGGCTTAITALPHPLIWFGGLLALIWVLARSWRDRTALAISVGFLVGWLPWLFFPERTTFQFYAVVYTPFLVLALVYALKRWRLGGVLLRRVEPRDRALMWLLVAALAMLLFFLSLWLGLAAPLDFWRLQLMMPNWI